MFGLLLINAVSVEPPLIGSLSNYDDEDEDEDDDDNIKKQQV